MALRTFFESIPSMTSHLDISIVWDAADAKGAHQIISAGFAEADRLINIISAWQSNTELYAVNQNAGIKPVKVCDELFYLVQRAIKISDLTNGLFDVTFASIDKIWYFDKPMKELPSNEVIAASVRNINYKHIQLNEAAKTIYISNQGTKIELGAIGKGFIANKIMYKLKGLGVQGGLVNAGGDLTTWGHNEHGNKWKVGVADPAKKEKYLAWLPLINCAVATSGSYERFAMINGQRYSHIIHPKTGWPVKGISSVTVISADVELCDAIATSVFLLGLEDGLAFINGFNDLQCFIIDEENKYHYSDNLKKIQYDATNV